MIKLLPDGEKRYLLESERKPKQQSMFQCHIQYSSGTSRTTEDSSSRRMMRLVPVFTLETNNHTNNECFAHVRPDG